MITLPWRSSRLKYQAAQVRQPGHPGLEYLGLEHVEAGTGALVGVSSNDDVAGDGVRAEAGDVLFGKLRPYLAKAWRVDREVSCSSEFAVLRPSGTLDRDFLFYRLLAHDFIESMTRATEGTKMPRVSPDVLANFRLGIPPLDTQRAIVAFLDCETARIDALAEKSQRLLELLDEKRTALICEAVHTGLDPEVVTVPSGIPWLGRVPSAWNLVPLRRLLRQVQRPVDVVPTQQYQEIGIRSWGRGVFHKDPVLGREIGEKRVFRVEPGDLVLNIVFAWEGAVAVVDEAERGMIASHRFPTFKHNADLVLLDYLLLFLRDERGRAIMGFHSPGAAGRNRTIRLKAFLSEVVPVPPLAAQVRIVKRLRREEARLVRLGRRTRKAVTLLKEYRTSLITAAVTGQINVSAS